MLVSCLRSLPTAEVSLRTFPQSQSGVQVMELHKRTSSPSRNIPEGWGTGTSRWWHPRPCPNFKPWLLAFINHSCCFVFLFFIFTQPTCTPPQPGLLQADPTTIHEEKRIVSIKTTALTGPGVHPSTAASCSPQRAHRGSPTTKKDTDVWSKDLETALFF